MLRKQWWIALAGTAGLALSPLGFAAVTAGEASHLGKDLTPIGAVAGGNADGTIPPWASVKDLVGGTNKAYFDDVIKLATPQSLEILRKEFEKLRVSNPQDFDALLKYLDSFTLADYPAISKQVDVIISKLPHETLSQYIAGNKDEAALAAQLPKELLNQDIQDFARKQRAEIGGGGKYEAPQFIITKDNLAKYSDHRVPRTHRLGRRCGAV